MGRVVEFTAKQDNGQMHMVLCPCTEGGSPYIPMAMGGDTPFVAVLICLECEREIPVTNGYINRVD